MNKEGGYRGEDRQDKGNPNRATDERILMSITSDSTNCICGEVRMVPIADIKIPAGRIVSGNISDLAASIKQLGLLNPITLSTDLVLIAGRDRTAACSMLKWQDIPAMIVSYDSMLSSLAEIDENLVRKVFTVLERADVLNRRKEIYEALHPQTKRGAMGAAKPKALRNVTAQSAITLNQPSFVKDVSKKTGLAERTIRKDIQIAKGIDPLAREIIRRTPLGNKKTELLQLARLKSEEQRQVAMRVEAGEISSVSESKKTPAKIICLQCYNLIRVPLEKKDIAAGYRHLVKCSKGYFGMIEPPLIPPRESCPALDNADSTITKEQRSGPRSVGYINLAAVLPPPLLAGIWKYVDGPAMVYLPGKPSGEMVEKRQEIVEAYKSTGSIRGAAKKTRTQRATVRAAIKNSGVHLDFRPMKIAKPKTGHKGE